MFQICVHGRGGQGVVTAAELLARAGFAEGLYVQAIPSFGSERTGAPVVAYCRFHSEPLHTRQPILNPDAVVVQDSTLLYTMDPFNGVSADGIGIINTTYTPEETVERAELTLPVDRVFTVPATELAVQYLGRPIPSGALLGAFAAATGQVSLESVLKVLNERFSGRLGEGNVRAATASYEWVKHGPTERILPLDAIPAPKPTSDDGAGDRANAPADIARSESREAKTHA